MKTILKWILLKLSCQRGEVGELDASAISDAIYTADVDDPEYIPEDDKKGDKKEEKKDPVEGDDKKKAGDKAEDKKDEKDEKKTDPAQDLEAKIEAKYKTEISKLEKEISRLGYQIRKEKKETKTEKPVFTKTQLMQLYKEHKEDPEVVFQIIDEMTKLGKIDAQDAAEKATDIKTKKGEMDSFIDRLYPDARREGSELHGEIQKAVEWAHLEGHPMAEHLAFSLLALKSLPDTIKKIKEEAKAEAVKTSEKDLASKAEEARKKKINESKPGSRGQSSEETKAASLSANELETAKRLGFTTKAQVEKYAKMLRSRRGTVQTEA